MDGQSAELARQVTAGSVTCSLFEKHMCAALPTTLCTCVHNKADHARPATHGTLQQQHMLQCAQHKHKSQPGHWPLKVGHDDSTHVERICDSVYSLLQMLPRAAYWQASASQ